MTQDQYGQARDSGYDVSGQAVEDEQTEEFDDGQEKKMTTFQKVASALRGDRPDRDTPDQDVPENAGTAAQTPAGPDDLTDPNGMATGHTAHDAFASGAGTPGTGTPDTFTPDMGAHEGLTRETGTQDTAAQDTRDLDARDSSLSGQDPNGTIPDEAAVGAGAARGDYWDVPDTHGTGQDQADVMSASDRPATHADADLLARQDAANEQDPTMTQPDVYGTDADPAAPTTDAEASVATATDVTPTDAETTGAGLTDAADAAGGTTAAYPQDGAATIPDVPVTQTADGPAQTADGPAQTEASGGLGRHAADPAQELHPGEAAELHPGEAAELHPGETAELHPGETAASLDDLGDLAYGKLIPDAADFTAQWQQIQFKFVDDPHASVTEAAEIVEQVTTKMEAAIQERQRAIQERQRAIQEQQRSLRDRWGEETQADTETLRATLRMYKAFLDQLVGPKA